MHIGLEGRRRRLCQGEKVEESGERSLKCHHLDHDQHLLRLGPVKFEQVFIEIVNTTNMF